MAEDLYILAIVLLLPLTAGMTVLQVDPYYALIVRGILGAVAALVYALLGAADVALTEALVGTMLAIALYAIAVRSAMCLRLGILEPIEDEAITPILASVRQVLKKYHLRLELLPYTDAKSLRQALADKQVHAICAPQLLKSLDEVETQPGVAFEFRVRRLYDILKSTLATATVGCTYVSCEQPQEIISPESVRVAEVEQ